MGEVAHPDQADAIRAGFLIGDGALDHLLHAEHAGMGAGDDGQRRIDPSFQRRAELADALVDADQVGGLAPELRRQQGVFQGQRRDAGTLQLHHRAHHVERIAVAVIGIGDHRQTRHPADATGLFDEFTEGDQGKIWRSQHLQRRHRAAKDADLEAEVGGNPRRHRVEYRSRVVTGGRGQQRPKIAAQLVMRNSLHDGFRQQGYRVSRHPVIARHIPHRCNARHDAWSLTAPGENSLSAHMEWRCTATTAG